MYCHVHAIASDHAVVNVPVCASESSEQLSQTESFVTIHPDLFYSDLTLIIFVLRSFAHIVILQSVCGERKGSMEKAVNG